MWICIYSTITEPKSAKVNLGYARSNIIEMRAANKDVPSWSEKLFMTFVLALTWCQMVFVTRAAFRFLRNPEKPPPVKNVYLQFVFIFSKRFRSLNFFFINAPLLYETFLAHSVHLSVNLWKHSVLVLPYRKFSSHRHMRNVVPEFIFWPTIRHGRSHVRGRIREHDDLRVCVIKLVVESVIRYACIVRIRTKLLRYVYNELNRGFTASYVIDDSPEERYDERPGPVRNA